MTHGVWRIHFPEMLGAVLFIMFAGFITGGLARLAVPGPDPMPIWLTIAIGLAGSWGGGAIAAAIWGWRSTGVPFLGFVAAILLVIAYRRFYQGRPITGPDALKFPERGIGLDRFRERRRRLEDMIRQQEHAQAQSQTDDRNDQLRKLADLHEDGILTDEEFEAKKRQLLEHPSS